MRWKERERSMSNETNETDNSITYQARRWGIRFVAIAGFCAILPFFGFAVRGFGAMGTWIFAGVLGSLGLIAIAISFSSNVTSFTALAAKGLLYLVVAVLAAGLIAIPIAIVYFLFLE